MTHETPWVVTLPLILLAIPSIAAGWTIGTVLYGGYFGSAIYISPAHTGLARWRGSSRRAQHDAARPRPPCRSG